MDQVFDKYLEKLSAALEQFGPHSAELAIAVGRIGAAERVLWGFILAALAVALLWGALLPLLRKLRTAQIDDDSTAVYFAGALIAGTVCFFLFGQALSNLTDLYAWAGLWRPEVYLAAKALKL